MMKRVLFFAAIAAAAISGTSCTSDEKSSVEFEKSLYTLSGAASAEVKVTVSEPVSSDLEIPLSFGGTAEIDKDYTVSSRSVTIAAGNTSGSITVTNTNHEEGSTTVQASITLSVPTGYQPGVKSTTIVSFAPYEAYIYTFKTAEADIIDGFSTTLSLTGTSSGNDIQITDDITIPLKVTGSGASYVSFDSGTPSAVIKAGSSKAEAIVKFSVSEGYTNGDKLVLSVDTAADPRYIPGDTREVSLTLLSIEPEGLIGTWNFSKVFDLDELETWFSEYEDDPTALPTHNEGFTLTFSKDADGTFTVTPNDKGDFANFFRKSAFVPATPKNYSAEGVVIGKNTVSECTMFMADAGYGIHTNMYYKLATANRAFSADTETLGEAVIVFTLVDEGLAVEFRDYNTPPFGEMWWDGTKFDPDMFGFASLFVKK